MKIKRSNGEMIELRLDGGESRAIRAALGEVCFGIRIENFEGVVGTTEQDALKLFEKLNLLDLERENTLNLTNAELIVIRNAHAETLKELGEWEYHARTGVDYPRGLEVLAELQVAAGA